MEGENHELPANDDDYDGTQDNDNGEDYEATIEEEELLEGADYADELKDLEDEGEMSIEELRRRYGYPPADDPHLGVAGNDSLDDEEDEDNEEGTSSAETLQNQLSRPFEDLGNSLSGLDDDDDDYKPPDPFKKPVRVDAVLFQADIPSLLNDDEKTSSSSSETSLLLWSSVSNSGLSNEAIDQFLSDVVDIRVSHDQFPPLKASKTRDDEDALCALFRNNYDINKAKESFPFAHINAPFRTVRPDALAWDDEEIKTFEQSLETYGKDFSTIRRLKLPYRKVGELVEYYYQWKLSPSYRIWREAHPQHVPVVQPHISAIFDRGRQEGNTEGTERNTEFPTIPEVDDPPV